ncbi:trimeric intracellular cation channel type B isoform X2 [Electrophorus electricus]|uniref:Transmembrane protein 38B n=1 Tax=Electrophorus electricus TaxID=8005 RepID=A0A4W4FB96_ELEEL|nr:trimeric intracellular cation channel type B isoform X2 [Electrophorus electricus]
MDVLALLDVNALASGLSSLSMFPYFDTAHYVVSVMALREQPGALEVSQRSPLACWFSSMLYCFGGAVLSGIIMAEAPVAPLANSTNVLLATLMWYLVFYCPLDAVYCCATMLPVRLVLTGMKEVTRTWKVLGGVTQASRKYKDGVFVMIAVGWAKGAGGGLMSNFEQLVRGIWKPETNELLKMSYPTKVTLLGALLFSLQQCGYLPLQTAQLVLLYTAFIVTNKVRMMLMGSSSSPFAPIESAFHKLLFARPLTSPTQPRSPARPRLADPAHVSEAAGKGASGTSNGSPLPSASEAAKDHRGSESSKKTN